MNTSPGPSDEMALRIAYLIAGYIQQTLSPQEHEELNKWVEASDENMLLFEELTDENNIHKGVSQLQETDTNAAYQRIRKYIHFTKEKKKIQLWPYAAAAAVLLAIATIYFFRPFSKKHEQVPVAVQPVHDIQPGANKAVLVLGDGSSIALDDAINGHLAVQGNIQVTKNDSTLSYHDHSEVGIKQEVVFNTLRTPSGGQYALVMQDGTKVWLNAASSIRFPSAFLGTERTVEITGEAYFEVAKDATRPFYVKTAAQDIQVLGTHFNVSAYEDEATSTTLLEGKVQVSAKNKTMLLAPGDQSTTRGNGDIDIRHHVDLDQTIAWKSGLFQFKNATITEIMQQVARWYDADIEYKGKVEQHFNASISRQVPVSKLLQLLEGTGSVHFQIEGKTITVLP